jgi:hypothetical protein
MKTFKIWLKWAIRIGIAFFITLMVWFYITLYFLLRPFIH